MTPGNVRPSPRPLTEIELRELLSPVLLALCEEKGRSEVARIIGCDPKTVSNARDEHTTLSPHLTFNLLLADRAALTSVLARYGIAAVDVDAVEDEDAAYDEAAELASEYLSRWTKARRGGARLCHQGRHALKTLAKGVRVAMGRAVRA